MQLISKEGLKDRLKANLYEGEKSEWDGGMCWVRYKDIIQEIDEIEPEEVRATARWGRLVRQNDFVITEKRMCTRCNGEPPAEEVKRYMFCPYCGATMIQE